MYIYIYIYTYVYIYVFARTFTSYILTHPKNPKPEADLGFRIRTFECGVSFSRGTKART